MARSTANPVGLTTYTSSLTTTRLDELIQGGLRRNAATIVRYYATVVLNKAHDDAPIRSGVLVLHGLTRGGKFNIWVESKGGLRISVGTWLYYAVFVEFGTRRTSAQPFLGPAVEYFREEWGRAVRGIFWTEGIRVAGI